MLRAPVMSALPGTIREAKLVLARSLLLVLEHAPKGSCRFQHSPAWLVEEVSGSALSLCREVYLLRIARLYL